MYNFWNRLYFFLMKKGPEGQHRPANTFEAAIKIGRIATADIQEELKEPSQKFKGGNARKGALSPEKRKEIAKKAAKTRWK